VVDYFYLSDEEMRIRSGVLLSIAVALLLIGPSSALAHRGEPISTEFALPFAPGTGNWKIQYEYEREGPGASEMAIPETELELGIFPRLQVNVGFPLLREDEGPGEESEVFGGKLELGARYLLFGGEGRPFAVSLQGEVEAPTGSSRHVGDATEVGAGIFTDRYLGQKFRLHSNLFWKTTVHGSREVERTFQYDHALVWFAAPRWAPVVELNGRTDTATGETKLSVQPEVIFFAGHHVELKAGLPVGLTSTTPDIGVRFELALIWGER
jgi:hypothetical protein